jgi:hypothetical protein
MNEEQIRKMLEDTYDEPMENTLRSMLKEFYNRKMLSIVVLVWAWAVVLMGGCIYSGIKFFDTDQLRNQIMFAVIFVCCFHGVGLIKIFAWQMIHKNSIKREVKRLELRIAELSEVVKSK